MSPSRGARRDDAGLDFERDEASAAIDPWEEASTPVEEAARKRVAVETFARHEEVLRRTACRYSLCDDDADEALQRTLEILLRKAPSDDPRALIRWTQTVVKHEAIAVRTERERILAGPAGVLPKPGHEDWISMLPSDYDGPPELAERQEVVERSREALATLKPGELRALSLLAEGYSYKEIGEITGFSSRKVNRCVAEGRERFRRFLVRRDGGARCTELAPLLSAFADDEADAGAVATLREHLRTCAHCRATLRAYRAAPGAAAALLPALPPVRGSLADRLHDAYAAVATRVGGGSGASDSTLGGIVAGGGTRGAGVAALAKVLAICAGTVGGAAACVATGVVPAPLIDPPQHHLERPAAKVTHHPHHRIEEEAADAVVEYETEPTVEAEPEPREGEATPEGREAAAEKARREANEAAAEPTSSTPPPSEGGAIEYVEPAPAPEPVESTSSSSSSSSSTSAEASKGTDAGEFGP